jgi:hypothetical protein
MKVKSTPTFSIVSTLASSAVSSHPPHITPTTASRSKMWSEVNTMADSASFIPDLLPSAWADQYTCIKTQNNPAPLFHVESSVNWKLLHNDDVAGITVYRQSELRLDFLSKYAAGRLITSHTPEMVNSYFT